MHSEWSFRTKISSPALAPAQHSKGEVYGTARNVKVGSADITIALDAVQGEDVSLMGGARPMGGALPPGHP